MKAAVLTAILVPALSAAALLLVGKRLGPRLSPLLGSLSVGVAFISGIFLLVSLLGKDEHSRMQVVNVGQWISSGALDAPFEFLIDPLSVSMVLCVTGVGFLIHVYSIGYMEGDERIHRFFGYMNLFVSAMLVLVLANNLLLMFLGWEGVGLCSYLLISFWFEREAAASAGKKAFVTNRIGDAGFVLGTLTLYSYVGTLRIHHESLPSLAAKAASLLTPEIATIACLLLFAGAVGKSAQFPLYVWLPDAMEGPTPVSALIHAATMVTAGVYMIARLGFLFSTSATASKVVTVVGAVTAFIAATSALGQYDLKKILAYSTISQLGFMFAAVGVGAYVAGIFHLITHAFFKALLFLGAGSVMHATKGETDIRRFGGLRKDMPVTAATFTVGFLAIAGLAPFAGFFSKDAILASVFKSDWWGQGLWVLLSLTALLTAVYMGRATFATFYAKPRKSHDDVHPHESPATMTVPLVVLAVGSAVAGFLEIPRVFPQLSRFLEPAVIAHEEVFGVQELVLAGTSLAVSIIGIWIAYSLWVSRTPEDRGRFLQALPAGTEVQELCSNGWYLDRIYSTVLVGGGQSVARFFAEAIDRSTIDGLVDAVGAFWSASGRLVARLQTGHIRRYALAVALGCVLVLAGFALAGPR
jgi:NADH-quinone oxidoreductase subunit L